MLYYNHLPLSVDLGGLIEDIQQVHPHLFSVVDRKGEMTDYYQMSCPFHKNGMERKPSFGMRKADGVCHCFTCGYKGDLTTFIRDIYGFPSRFEAMSYIVKTYTPTGTHERPLIDLDLSRDEKPTPKYVSMEEVEFYHQSLDSKALGYLSSRGITKHLGAFKIGYDKATDSITIPIFTTKGDVGLIKRRKIERKIFLNDKGMSKTECIFGLYQCIKYGKTDMVWLCESEIDALYLWQFGIPAIAIMGSHISERQIEILSRSPIRHLVDGMDRDGAGRLGIKIIKDTMIPLGFRFYRPSWIKGKKDVNEMSKDEILSLTIE